MSFLSLRLLLPLVLVFVPSLTTAQELSLSVKLDPRFVAQTSTAVVSREIADMVKQRCSVSCASVSLEITSDVTDMEGAFRYLDPIYKAMTSFHESYAIELVFTENDCCVR